MRCLVVGGAGAVGGLLAGLLRAGGHDVGVLDLADDPQGGEGTDITGPLDGAPAERLAAADMVLLAVPETVALQAIPGVVAAMADGALLVDTLSVKADVVELLHEQPDRVEALSINPMFAPSLSPAGRAVAVVVVRDGPRGRELQQLLTGNGARLVRLDAQRHDRLAAAAQVLTHAAVLGFGLALGELDVDVAELAAVAPPPHATLLALLARIAGGTPEVYWDVQAANPLGTDARTALANGVRELTDVIDKGDPAAFTSLLTEVRAHLGEHLPGYRELCARLFDQLDGPIGPTTVPAAGTDTTVPESPVPEPEAT